MTYFVDNHQATPIEETPEDAISTGVGYLSFTLRLLYFEGGSC